MPYKYKEDLIENKCNYYIKNKEIINQKHKEYYEKNKKKIMKHQAEMIKALKEWSSIKYYLRRFFKGNGVCLICGEINPFTLENHHVIKDLEFQVILCANCHGLMDRFKNSISVWEGKLNGEIFTNN